MTFGAVTSASADDLVEGGVYGWGREGSGVAATPFELQFPNDAGPFVDVAITGSSGSEQTTLAVTEDGDVVTQGNHRNIVSNMPATIAAADVIAIDVAGFAEGNALGAAVVTRDGRVITWNTMPAMTQACVTAAAAAGGVQDVQVVLSGSQFRGVALLKDGSLCSWANFSSFVSAQPKGKNFVKVAVDRDHSIALTSDGKVQAWSHTAGSRVVSNIGALEGHTIVDIAVSESIGAAVTDTGEVIVWGGDSEGNVKPTDQFPADQARALVDVLVDTAEPDVVGTQHRAGQHGHRLRVAHGGDLEALTELGVARAEVGEGGREPGAAHREACVGIRGQPVHRREDRRGVVSVGVDESTTQHVHHVGGPEGLEPGEPAR